MKKYRFYFSNELRGWVVVVVHFRLLLITTLAILVLVAALLQP